MSQKCMARIVPVPAEDGETAHRTQGTKVMVGDVELHGVTRIELLAEIDSVWKARIDCHLRMTDMQAEAVVSYPRMTLFEHLRDWWRNRPPARDGGPG